MSSIPTRYVVGDYPISFGPDDIHEMHDEYVLEEVIPNQMKISKHIFLKQCYLNSSK